MQLTFAIGALLLGAIAGSFLNALSFRWGTGVSIVGFSGARSRSRCMHCGATLAVADLVPVLSYIWLRGRCRYCGVRISPQYPLVEAASALLSLLVYLMHQDPALYVYWLVVWMILLFIVIYDLRHKIIPWSLSIVLAVLGLLHVWSAGFSAGGGSAFGGGVWDFAAGPVLAAPLLLLFVVSGGKWMGLGDAALELGLGWLLGLTAGLTALVLAFWVGAVVGIAALMSRRGVTMKSEVPFAPFLILGAAVALFLHVDLFQALPLMLP